MSDRSAQERVLESLNRMKRETMTAMRSSVSADEMAVLGTQLSVLDTATLQVQQIYMEELGGEYAR